MSHTVTAKLNKAANKHQNQSGTTFFVSLGEKNYNFKAKANEWTNYEAALFAKDAQVGFYETALVEGSIIEVTGTGIIMDATDTNYKPKLIIQDAKLGFIHSSQPAPQQQAQQNPPQAQWDMPPQQAPAPQQQPQQQAPQQTPPPQQEWDAQAGKWVEIPF
tara:strand:- start:1109 stop:1591 length:483 start_codon:yes stop_codon:yes gene_type:complete